jgi:hypothetical protein
MKRAQKVILLLVGVIITMAGSAQMQHFSQPNDEFLTGVCDLQNDKYLIYGEKAFELNGENYATLFEYDLLQNTLVEINLNFPVHMKNFTHFLYKNDTIFGFGFYSLEIQPSKNIPCYFMLDSSYNIIHFNNLNIPTDKSANVEKVLLNKEEIIIAVTEYSNGNFFGNHIALLRLNDGFIKRSIYFQNQNTAKTKFCTAIAYNNNNNEIFFTLYESSEGEEIHTLDNSFNHTFIKNLPAKPNASPGEPGYVYRVSRGSAYINNKYYLSISHKNIFATPTPPFGEQFMALMIFDENLDSLSVVRIGQKNKTSTLIASSFSNNNFYLTGIDTIYGTNYPPKGSPSGIMYAKLDTLGNILWEGTYTDSSFYLSNNIIGLSDGGCLIVGSRYLEGESQYLDPFVMRVNNVGEVTSIAILEKPEIGIYPNPTKDGKITVQFTPEQAVNTWQFRVVNLQGQLMEQGSLAPYENQLTLNENLPAGNYIITFYGNNMAPVSKRITKL